MSEYKLEEIVSFIDGDRGRNYPKQHEYLNEGHCIFLNTSNVTSKGFNFDKVNYISENKHNLLRNGKLEVNDIILTTRGTIGNVGLYNKFMHYPMRINSSMLIIRVKEKISSDFLYYVFKSESMKNHMLLFSSGSAQPQLPVKDLKKIKISIPSKNIQQSIVNILSTYDKLIENNSRRIQILEQTAEELYKEWFVRMRFPGYEKTKFEKGIPEGWEVQKLSEVIKVTDGTHDTPKEVSDGRPLVTGKNIVNGQIDFNTTYNISEDDYKKINVRSSVEKNDILYSNIGTIGQMSIVHDDNKYSVKNLIILKTSKYNFYEYIYLHFKNEACQNHFDSIANGASQRFISLTEMRNYKILIPNKEILEEFRSYVRILFNQVKNLTIQNQNLTKQRDLLLPRLMNGTISVE